MSTKFERKLAKIENFLTGASLGLAAIFGLLQILAREVFGVSIRWTQEATIYLIICSTYFGSVVALRRKEHISVDILKAVGGARWKRFIAILESIVLMAFLIIFTILAWRMVLAPYSRATNTPVMDIPLWVVELAVPIGFSLMLIRAMTLIWRRFRGPAVDETPNIKTDF